MQHASQGFVPTKGLQADEPCVQESSTSFFLQEGLLVCVCVCVCVVRGREGWGDQVRVPEDSSTSDPWVWDYWEVCVEGVVTRVWVPEYGRA